jgi:hypothetical protein
VRFLRRGRSEDDAAEVERAMERVAADDTADTRSVLYRALLDATLVVATPHAPAVEGARIAQEGDTIELVMHHGEDGPVLPVFTSVERLLEWQPQGGGYAALQGRALFELALATEAAWLAVNPGSATSGAISRYELESLARGRMPIGGAEVMAEGAEVRIGQAAHPPPADAVAALRRAVEAEQHAVAAWLFLMQEGSSEPEHVLGIALADGVTEADGEAALRGIAEEAGAQSPGARDILVMAIGDKWRGDLEDGAGELLFTR